MDPVWVPAIAAIVVALLAATSSIVVALIQARAMEQRLRPIEVEEREKEGEPDTVDDTS